jgi:hypothetical protein
MEKMMSRHGRRPCFAAIVTQPHGLKAGLIKRPIDARPSDVQALRDTGDIPLASLKQLDDLVGLGARRRLPALVFALGLRLGDALDEKRDKAAALRERGPCRLRCEPQAPLARNRRTIGVENCRDKPVRSDGVEEIANKAGHGRPPARGLAAESHGEG